MKLFQYALILRAKDKKPELVKSKQGFLITTTLSDDLEKAKVVAARDIPDDINLEEVEIAIRPF